MSAMTSAYVIPLAFDLGAPELLIILAVIVLLFGASKLPELARGSGRALRIFKAETKGLMDDDDADKTPEQRRLDAANRTTTDDVISPAPQATPVVPPVTPVAPQVTQQPNPEDTRPPGSV
jgi:sec-independent protein translocase protein TatA